MLQTTMQALQAILDTDQTIGADERKSMLECLRYGPMKAETKAPASVRLLNNKQAADMLGLSKQTIRRLVKAGRLPVVETRVGRMRIPEQAVIELTASATRKGV
jgi:excisionase family DNA binding protein